MEGESREKRISVRFFLAYLQKSAELFAHVKKKQYLCTRFSPDGLLGPPKFLFFGESEHKAKIHMKGFLSSY